ncbi:hypothetical protein L915_17448 [Phytophthora nicotianae]|uniref:Uncharacterized protein n=1 Tax=Phytophthora nicotianae TaxID=4792 RepID=W2I5Q3_PHYNI|nr:hypothetical protein L915_17448 [Phytophthora nicotianae]ETL29491.1 hypothetical protein L916_17339 [Phytophthora nicotianae]
MVQALLHEGIYREQKVIVRKDGLVYRRHVVGGDPTSYLAYSHPSHISNILECFATVCSSSGSAKNHCEGFLVEKIVFAFGPMRE